MPEDNNLYNKNSVLDGKNENIDILLHDQTIEQEILGSILIANAIFRYIELDLTEDSFYFDLHKTIFAKIKKLLQEAGSVDETTLYYNLADMPNLPYRGEELKKYIADIVLVGAKAIHRPKEMVEILNFLALKRKISLYHAEVYNLLEQSTPQGIDERISQLEQSIYNIANNQNDKDINFTLGKYTAELKKKLEKARKSDKEILGVKTGLTDIDGYTGGLQNGDLIIIAARPSMGKTALATTIAKNIATILRKEKTEDEKQQAVAFFSLEMSGEQLTARIVAMDSNYSTKAVHTGRYDEKDDEGNIIKNKKISDNDWAKIYQSMQDISELPLYIDDTPALDISLLRSRARYMKNRYNICAIIIDYLQLLKTSGKYQGQRVLELGEITGTLKAIAKELGIPVIALSQLSRAVEGSDRKDKRPQLSDLRESGTIEQDADIVMLLYREEYYLSRSEPKITDTTDEMQINNHAKWLKKYEQVKNLAEIIVAKNRNGPVGTIILSFDKEHMLFSGYDKTRDQYNYAGNTQATEYNSNITIQPNNTNPQIANNIDFEQSPFNSPLEDTANNDDIPDDLKNIFD